MHWRGLLLGDYALLMSKHWIRVVLITTYGITYFFMLIKSATALPGGRFMRFQNAAEA